MKKVLFVDDEKMLLESVSSGFLGKADIELLTAENGKLALKALEQAPVDLIVTDLRMPEMDGFELLARLNAEYPAIPVVVMSAYGTPEIENRLKNLGIAGLLDKPLDYDKMMKIVDDSLRSSGQAGSVSGISLSNFLQLIQMEEKTCLLEVQSEENGKGFFYFNEGVLYDAVHHQLKGEQAALEMMTWDNVKLFFRSLPLKRIRKSIEKNLISLLMEAANAKDESKGETGEDTPRPLADPASPHDEPAMSEEEYGGEDFELIENPDFVEELPDESREDFDEKNETAEETLESQKGEDESEKGGFDDPTLPFSDAEYNPDEVASDEKYAFADNSDDDPANKPADESAGPEGVSGGNGSTENVGSRSAYHKEGEGRMAGYKGLLKEMAEEIDGVMALGLYGMDGIAVATHNPGGANTDAFGAKFAMIMRLVEKSSKEIENLGKVEENLVQSEGAWIVTKFVSPQYYLGVIVGRDSTLGNVRLVTNKFLPKFAAAMK